MKLTIGKSFAEIVKGQQIVGTVSSIKLVEMDDQFNPGQKRESIVINFDEFGDNGWWPSKAALKHIMKVLGDETDDWKGKQIPLERVKSVNQKTGELVEKFHPMAIDVWDQAVRAYNAQLKTARQETKSKVRR